MTTKAAGADRIATNLCRYRAAAGLSKAELARRAGLSRSAVVRLEDGTQRNPEISTLTALGKVLRCQVTDFFRGAASSRPPRRLRARPDTRTRLLTPDESSTAPRSEPRAGTRGAA